MHRIVWLPFVFFWPSLLLAQQPFSTDDADVTPANKVHFEAFDEYDWLQHSQIPHLRQNTINMRVNYGLGKGIELDLDSPLLAIANDASADLRHVSGIGDTNFGVKYNPHPEHGRSPAVSFAAYIETPTGDSTNGLGSGLTDIWVYGILQKTLAPGTVLRGNAGYLFTGNTSTGVVGITTVRGHVATMGASVIRNFTRKFDLGVEISAAAARNADLQRDQLQYLLGGNYAIRENFSLDIGVVRGHFDASPRFGLQIGFSWDP